MKNANLTKFGSSKRFAMAAGWYSWLFRHFPRLGRWIVSRSRKRITFPDSPRSCTRRSESLVKITPPYCLAASAQYASASPGMTETRELKRLSRSISMTEGTRNGGAGRALSRLEETTALKTSDLEDCTLSIRAGKSSLFSALKVTS